MASHLLNNKLAQKVSFHQCSHSHNKLMSLSVVWTFSVNVSGIYFYTIFKQKTPFTPNVLKLILSL